MHPGNLRHKRPAFDFPVIITERKNDGQDGFRDSGQRLRYTERHGLAVADFNKDGYLDVFAAAGDEFCLWLNQGDGRLEGGK